MERQLSIREIAQRGGIEQYYNAHYRLYCRATHAALRATLGYMDEFSGHDNISMAGSALMATEGLISIGARAPNRDALFKRLNAVDPPDNSRQ
jgi:hypothetical protein